MASIQLVLGKLPESASRLEHERRAVLAGEVELAIEIANITYRDWFTVSPTDSRYEMILGMRFLNDPNIDVAEKTKEELVRLAGDKGRITSEGF